LAQQSNWETLAAATEKMNQVFNLLDNAESEEQKELGVLRAHSKVLEDENAAMQKRFKELDTKLANSDRSAATARQTLTQAQQRSSEWERRAKEYEGQLERMQTKYEQSEQTQSQLDADFSMLKLQLEEQEADNRLLKVNELHLM
jgi:septal ring factor EnvC (AmiA/AmiB activator)